ncbi:cytochrome P450 [Lasiosphaeria ovina]|uniref:Cytochrome P450 n=1 Tax=Lasiosphaeria ovina TaxID=92902 RepID=A0AAE0JUM2_9PEZI|nr:cytochrome P450 [Lasiosphaeria ovina]
MGRLWALHFEENKRQTFLLNARDLYLGGYRKFKNGIYRIGAPNWSTVVVLSPKFLPELNKPPEDILSLAVAIEELLRIVAAVSGLVFVVTDMGWSEEYLDIGVNYTVEFMLFAASRLPEVKKLNERLEQAHALLRPVIEARQQLADAGGKTPCDMQLNLISSSIYTTTIALTNAPKLAAKLRAEVRRVLSRYRGVLCSRELECTRRLDSFVTETMRGGPHSVNTFQRKGMRPFRLSTGQEISAGVVIDRVRKAQPVREGRHFGPDYEHHFDPCKEKFLTFGYGRHAYPGRFLASKEIKAIVANVLILCEIKLADGVTEQDPNLTFGSMFVFMKRDFVTGAT